MTYEQPTHPPILMHLIKSPSDFQIMADLNKKLPLESLSDESWFADKNARNAKVVARTPSNNAEKSLFRQMAWVNNNTDLLGDILRFITKFEVDANVDTAEKQYFSATNKNILMQKIRGISVSNNNNAAYLRLAKDFSYEAADEFETGVTDDVSMDETTASKMDKIAKKHAIKGEKFRQAPYQKRSSGQNHQQQYSQQAQLYPQQYPQQYHQQVQQPYGQPMFSQQQQQQQQFPYPQMPFSRQNFFPAFGGPGGSGRARGHGGGINKTNSICKDCKGIGHW